MGAVLAILPVPVALMVALGLLVALPIELVVLVLEARVGRRRWTVRDWLRGVARPMARMAACVALLGVAAAMPLKPLDRRVAIASEVSVEDAVAALKLAGIRVRGVEAAGEIRLVVAPNPRAREVADAIARATGSRWRSSACLSGATLLTGTGGGTAWMRQFDDLNAERPGWRDPWRAPP